jgi:hypothetical protein
MSAVPAASARPNVASSIAIVGVLFFLIGFFTWLNGPLITFVKLAFELSEVGAFLVLMVVDPAPHRHEERPEPEPAGDGRRRCVVR